MDFSYNEWDSIAWNSLYNIDFVNYIYPLYIASDTIMNLNYIEELDLIDPDNIENRTQVKDVARTILEPYMIELAGKPILLINYPEIPTFNFDFKEVYFNNYSEPFYIHARDGLYAIVSDNLIDIFNELFHYTIPLQNAIISIYSKHIRIYHYDETNRRFYNWYNNMINTTLPYGFIMKPIAKNNFNPNEFTTEQLSMLGGFVLGNDRYVIPVTDFDIDIKVYNDKYTYYLNRWNDYKIFESRTRSYVYLSNFLDYNIEFTKRNFNYLNEIYIKMLQQILDDDIDSGYALYQIYLMLSSLSYEEPLTYIETKVKDYGTLKPMEL